MGKDRNIFPFSLNDKKFMVGGRKSNKLLKGINSEKGCSNPFRNFFILTLLLTEVKFNHIELINLNPMCLVENPT